MTPRFRMIAGPNGSGKTTLHRLLSERYAVNFYAYINADDLLAEAVATHALRMPLPIEPGKLEENVAKCSFPCHVMKPFRDGSIALVDDILRFNNVSSITSYTISFIANFIREQMIMAGLSCSQETVFSHKGKIDALREAKAQGFRTYLYFVATDNPAINLFRVRTREANGGHGVPYDKVISRYYRSLENIAAAIPHLDRAFFFDDSGLSMRYLAEYSASEGFTLMTSLDSIPEWFSKHVATGRFP